MCETDRSLTCKSKIDPTNELFTVSLDEWKIILTDLQAYFISIFHFFSLFFLRKKILFIFSFLYFKPFRFITSFFLQVYLFIRLFLWIFSSLLLGVFNTFNFSISFVLFCFFGDLFILSIWYQIISFYVSLFLLCAYLFSLKCLMTSQNGGVTNVLAHQIKKSLLSLVFI